MSDKLLRDRERRWHETGASDDEALYLQERVRSGDLPKDVLRLAGLLGHEAAAISSNSSDEQPVERDRLSQRLGGFRKQVLELFPTLHLDFGNIPEAARGFFEQIRLQDFEARSTLAHYGLVENGDVPIPSPARALNALAEDLRNHPQHMDAIAQMHKPVLQLIPIYDHEGAGFQRMVDVLDLRGNLKSRTSVFSDVRDRWGMNERMTGKIVRWQVAVSEGVRILPEESYVYNDEYIEDHLSQSLADFRTRGLRFCDNRTYALLQMQQIRQAAPDTPMDEIGIDPGFQTGIYTMLEDHTYRDDSFIACARSEGFRLEFAGYTGLHYPFRLRRSVVVDVP